MSLSRLRIFALIGLPALLALAFLQNLALNAQKAAPTTSLAQNNSLQPHLVKDINANTLPSNPEHLTDVDGTLFFVADDGIHGRELWRSDGTITGTAMVKDITAGDSSLRWLTNVSGTLFFLAVGPNWGLWRSDGTVTGTFMLKELVPYHMIFYPPGQPTNVSGTLFFGGADDSHSTELWRSDGTVTGTVMVKDIREGGQGSGPQDMTNVNGTLFFTAYDENNGRELWRSDGTETGTVLVKDINPGVADSGLLYPFAAGDLLFFSALDSSTGYELWRSDGTGDGTFQVRDVNPGPASSGPYGFNESISINDTYFFAADDGTHGEELWRSDGTISGTVMVSDIYTGTGSSSPYGLTGMNGTLYFGVNDGPRRGLWRSDGTVTGTVLVSESIVFQLAAVDSTLFFSTSRGAIGEELWRSDGTEPGTVLVKDLGPADATELRDLTSSGGELFFSAANSRGGRELWHSDGTEAGTVRIPINRVTESSYPWRLADVGDVLFFAADTGSGSNELWRSDGSTAGTYLVKYIGDELSNLIDVDGVLFIASLSGQLWRSDGTADGTVFIRDGVSNQTLTDVNSTLFFVADDGIHGRELWRSDGTLTGTVMVKDIFPDSMIYNPAPEELTNVGGVLFFTADNGTDGRELWRSDGTAIGTYMISDIHSGTNTSWFSELTNVNATLFFSASDGTATGLWRSDGTITGTVLVKELQPFWLTDVEATLYFISYGSYGDDMLWQSDGTEAGTAVIRDGLNRPESLTDVNGLLFFTDSQHQLWRSDGTLTGTFKVGDYENAWELTEVNGTLLFIAQNNFYGQELWRSDGTVIGTVMVTDSLSSLSQLTAVDSLLFFSANDGTHGNELWALAVDAPELSLQKSVTPTALISGEALTYTVMFMNTGQLTATNILITDTLPAELTDLAFSNSGATITLTGDLPYTWQVADLALGQGGIITITARALESLVPGTQISNTASIMSDQNEWILSNNRDSALLVISDVAVAGLNITSTSPTQLGLATNFTATISAGTNVSYNWDFGDGRAGQGQTVSHIYDAVGTYTVTATATNSVSQATDSAQITVNDVAIANLAVFSDSPTRLGETTTLTATVSAGTNVSFNWDLGDSTIRSGNQISHTYAAIGQYTVTVTASNSVSQMTETTLVIVESGQSTVYLPSIIKELEPYQVDAVRQ